MKARYIWLAAALLTAGCAKVETEVSSVQDGVSDGLVWREALSPTEKGWTVVRAGIGDDAETRSRILLNDAATEAEVLWTAGDSFTSLFSHNSGAGYYSTTFTTAEDGVSVASFTSPYHLEGYCNFHCFYPDKYAWSIYNGEFIVAYDLPAVQTAVPGGIQEGLNRAYAYADQLSQTLQEPLRFHNLPSLLKFRLSGAVVSQVHEVHLYGTGVLAGDMVFRRNGESLTEYPGLHYTASYADVVLQGDFEADTDYYIALWPRQMDGFRMVFSDGEGNSTTKYSGKTVSFEASRAKDFGTIALGDAFEDLNDGSLDPIKYLSATEGTKPVTIAVIPEGFTKEELPSYEVLAKVALDALFNVEPYKTYRNRFNAYILKVASHESGASYTDGNGNITQRVYSYFGARWGENSYNDMSADASTVYGFVAENCPDIVKGIHSIKEVPILMIINDFRYGGRCSISSDGRAYAMVPFTYEGGGIRWSLPDFVASTDDPLPEPVTDEVIRQNTRDRTSADLEEVGGSNRGDWRNTVAHEFGGHCFGRLGDEYWSSKSYNPNPIGGHTWPVAYSLNVAIDPVATPWKTELQDRYADLVALDARYGRIGAFQGAGGGSLFGRWRSEKISCMIDNRYYFSAWQRYLITQRIFTLSGDLDSFSFESWLAKDVTLDPVRDQASSGIPSPASVHRTYTPVGPLPPPALEEE